MKGVYLGRHFKIMLAQVVKYNLLCIVILTYQLYNKISSNGRKLSLSSM